MMGPDWTAPAAMTQRGTHVAEAIGESPTERVCTRGLDTPHGRPDSAYTHDLDTLRAQTHSLDTTGAPVDTYAPRADTGRCSRGAAAGRGPRRRRAWWRHCLR